MSIILQKMKHLLKNMLSIFNLRVARHVRWNRMSRIPKGIVPRTESWLATQGYGRDGITYYQRVIESHVIERILPKSIHLEIHPAFCKNQRHQVPMAFVASIPDGRVWDHTAVISQDDYLLEDLSQWFGPSPVNPVLGRIKLPPAKRFEGEVVNLAAGAEGYFHWMFDVLPRLHLLSQADGEISNDALFLLNNFRDGYQKETSRRAGIPDEQVVTLNEHPHVQASKLTVPSFPGISGHVPKWASDFVRSLFSDVLGDSQPQRRLYISRSRAGRRRVVNEDEVRSFLEPLGFETVHLETMPVVEQAKLMNEAEAVVGPHGAGLANLVFCKQSTTVIEMFSARYVNECYWSLSNHLSLDYYYYVADTNDELRSQSSDGHFSVSLDDLGALLDYAGLETCVGSNSS
ncbi:MAG: DUF563 domain-containing protein [Salinibacter sp.]